VAELESVSDSDTSVTWMCIGEERRGSLEGKGCGSGTKERTASLDSAIYSK
jgi:hypothetical protein